jgi:hypothetical protein
MEGQLTPVFAALRRSVKLPSMLSRSAASAEKNSKAKDGDNFQFR